jgi:hypothetical protein
MDTAPVSSETYLSATGLPEKNSPAVTQGSMDDAGGKMSDWNESDWVGCGVVRVRISPRAMGMNGRNLTYLAWDDERDGLDGLRGGDFVRACDFAFRGVDCAPWDEAHPALRIARFVLVQRVKVIALVFIVPDISVALASYDHGSRGVWADIPR